MFDDLGQRVRQLTGQDEPPRLTGLTVPDGFPGGGSSEPAEDTANPVNTVDTVRSGGGAGPDPAPIRAVRDHFARYILPLRESDLTTLTLWAAHTHLIEKMWTTPRICLTSPMPESGKTTVLEHFERLCLAPCSMASAGTPALLTRMLHAGMRTLLIDEAEKNLRPDKPETGDLLAILNSGYKKGGVRPVLTAGKNGEWQATEMSTFAPVAMAGIAPDLPDDTISRTLFIVMLPDHHGVTEESDWERIEPAVVELGGWLAQWAAGIELLPDIDADLPEGCKGRMKEKWRPLMRVARLAGQEWVDECRDLITSEIEDREHDKAEGLLRELAPITLLKDIMAEWPTGVRHWRTDLMRQALVERHPDHWGATDRFPTGLTVQRIGHYLGRNLKIRSTQIDRERGYLRADVEKVAARLGIA